MMSIKRRWLQPALLAALLLAPGAAQAYFEGLRPCTRAVGMGEAFTGIADDANAIYYNPAGLGLLDKIQVPTSYNKVFGGLDLGGIYQTYFAAAGPVPRHEWLGSFGLAWYRRASNIGINEDESDQPVTYNLLNENLLYLSWGRKADWKITIPRVNRSFKLNNLYLGLSMKIPFYRWNQDVAGYNPANDYWDGIYGSTGLSFDLAGLYFPKQFPEMTVGVALIDLIKTDIGMHTTDVVETRLAMGSSYLIKSYDVKEFKYKRLKTPAFKVTDLKFAADAVISTEAMAFHHLHFGAEKWFNQLNQRDQAAAARTGFKLGARSYLFYALGGSYRYFLPKAYGGFPFKYGFQFDYAFLLPLSGIKSTYGDHSFTVTLLQGGPADVTPPEVSAEVAPEVFSPDGDNLTDQAVFTLSAKDENPLKAWSFVIVRKLHEPAQDSGDYQVLKRLSGGADTLLPGTVTWDGKAEGALYPEPNGDYFYELTATDRYQNTGATGYKPVRIDVLPMQLDVEAAAPAFAPNGDGVADEIIFRTTVDRRLKVALWNLVIEGPGASGTWQPVRTIAGKELPPVVLLWDGLFDNGGPALHNAYRYQLTAVDQRGNQHQGDYRTVRVDLRGPDADLSVQPVVFSPNGDGNNDVTQFTFSLADSSQVDRWQLDIVKAGDSTTTAPVMTLKGGEQDPRTVTWAGRDSRDGLCPDGQYLCRLTAWDKLGNLATAEPREVMIGTDDGLYRVFSPNHDSQFDTLEFSLPATARAYDRAILVITDQNKQPVCEDTLKPRTFKYVWRGQDRAGTILPDAAYTYQFVFIKNGKRADASLPKVARIDNTAPELTLLAVPAAFSPVKAEKTTFNLLAMDVSPVATWQLDVTDKDGNPYQSFNGTGAPLAGQVWDGKNAAGTFPEEGAQVAVVLTAADAVGNRRVSRPVVVMLMGKVKILPIDPIRFETGRAVIKSESYPVLDGAAQILKDAGTLPIAVNGHTDNSGDPAKNLKLSQERAQSVADYLVKFHQIPRERFAEIKGYGDTQPIDDNKTKEGQSKNRRVEIILLEQ
jgi:outer membrane protein OmpA-like peptidoglycan-associated protein/flagellar hook assembly protein FlgD